MSDVVPPAAQTVSRYAGALGKRRSHTPRLTFAAAKISEYAKSALPFSEERFNSGLKWTRTTDLTLIRRVL